MSSGLSTTGSHPVTDFVTRLTSDLDALAATPTWSMVAEEIGADLVAVTRARARLEALEMRLLTQARHSGVGDRTGDDPRAWWQHHSHLTRPTTRRAERLARSLDGDRAAVGAALAAGLLLVEQAESIVWAIDELPADLVPAEVIAAAESHLITLAASHDARELRVLGRRVLEVVAPDIAEEHERRQLEKDEAKARATARFTMSSDGHGRCHGRFTIPELQGEMLRKALLALANPARHHGAGDSPDENDALNVKAPLRMGHAFMEYVERYPTDRLARAGGVAATVVVTTTVEQLRSGLGAATLDTGAVISATELRRMACGAGIIPAVLDGDGQLLDVGRKSRFHTEPQRVALTVRDRGCTATGCDWPPGLCHAHHDVPWSEGGGTSVRKGRLLCPRHHRRAHDPRYDLRVGSDNRVSFHRRT